ncbi:MAG: methyltransferase [Cytophagales bacterium CG12_big_fil_rev_8_21_14_0_65_40_12]|nr:MAG: methyltransferase [Cytophagales bacterium CG12_big_fil_rev_8_21_14_0_65_40_12]
MNAPIKPFSKITFLFRALKYRYRNDREELQYIMKNVKHGNTVLDIGAHKGAYLYWLRKAVGPKGQVIALEPQPTLFQYLETAISKFGFKNIKIHHAGASSVKDTLSLFIPKAEGGTSPGATFEKRETTENSHLIEVEVIPLNDLLKNRKSKIDFIKMDVEGHELDAFKGASDILLEDRPTILFECENRHLKGITIFDVFAYLNSLGYSGFFFLNSVLTPLEQFDIAIHQATHEGEIIDKKKYINNFVFKVA